MNTKLTKIYLPVAFSLLACATSCSDKDVSAWSAGEEEENARYLEYVDAFIATRDDDGDDVDPDDPQIPEENGHVDNEEALELLDDGFKPGDLLFFTQLVTGKLEPFVSIALPDDAPESMKERFGETYDNVYQYQYQIKNYEADWDNGYNFFPNPLSEKLDWDDIKYWGLNNNGFALYALYFPYDNQLNLNFQVEEDQTDLANLQKSNFIGAYHSSSSAFTRLRFKLYHLMAYLKVTLYVPVYNDNDTDKDGNKIRTGFPADALQSAEVLDVMTDFSINWYANRSSDTSPACSANPDSERTNVLMYIPPLSSYPDGVPPMVNIKTSEFYNPNDMAYNPDATDLCWEITLSVLIPAGQDFTSPSRPWTDGNILRFNMRQNIGEVPKRYVFNGSSDMGLIGEGEPLTISQGNIQHLNLYLPRYGAAAILMGANVENWKTAYNDNMGLRQDDPLATDEPDPTPDPLPED